MVKKTGQLRPVLGECTAGLCNLESGTQPQPIATPTNGITQWCNFQGPQMELQLRQLNTIIAMKRCVEDVECLRFKLRTFGIPLVDENKPETKILCDKEFSER